jgi:hypothetical protein
MNVLKKRMTLGKLRKIYPQFKSWMTKAVETLDDDQEIICRYWPKSNMSEAFKNACVNAPDGPEGYVLIDITFDEFGPPIS